ncbi:hypothetical protein [Candidatus Poriferisodalis sp.]|uniref:hypothetical protein n=1 Tax=Candidatus Poriferisodalis sp. TaxID=3101277 RepID=UPI003C701467
MTLHTTTDTDIPDAPFAVVITSDGIWEPLLRLIAQALELKPDFFDRRFWRPLVGTRLIRYPAIAEPLPDQLGCGGLPPGPSPNAPASVC